MPAKSAPRSGPKREIHILSTRDVQRLLAACSRRSPTGLRNGALVALLFGAGLRLSEALALKVRDFDMEQRTVTVHHGKGDKRRVSAIVSDAVPYLDRWLEKRKALGITGHKPVFCTITASSDGTLMPGSKLKDAYVRASLRRIAEKAGLGKRVHAHGFRHSHAFKLHREGWSVLEIQKQLGHANLAVTSVYLGHIGAHELAERMGETSWGF